MRDRHLDFFLALGELAEPHLTVGDPGWLARIETEYGNFRGALEHAILGDAKVAVRLGVTLDWFWDFSGRQIEGYAVAMRLLELTANCEPGKLRADALELAGSRASMAGEYDAARVWLVTALEMARRINDKSLVRRIVHDLAATSSFCEDWAQLRAYAQENLALSQELEYIAGISDAFWQLGRASLGEGDRAAARSFFEQSLEIARRAKFPNGISFNLGSLASIAFLEGDYAAATQMYKECAQIRRQMRHRTNLAGTLIRLGEVALCVNDPVRARASFAESFALWRELEDVEGQIWALDGFAGVAGVTHRYVQAARLFGAVEALSKAMGFAIPPLPQMVYAPMIDAARSQLGESKFDALWAEGRAMSLEQAIDLALSD